MGNPELGTILIIDDEPDLVTYYKALFEDHNYKVISATDGERGLELARKQAPNLICLDISMPAPSGVRTAACVFQPSFSVVSLIEPSWLQPQV